MPDPPRPSRSHTHRQTVICHDCHAAMRACALCGVVVFLATTFAAADSPAPNLPDTRLHITIDQAVPFDASDYKPARRGDRPSLQLELLSIGGNIQPEGHAWCELTPALEHPVAVHDAQWEADTLTLDLTVTLRHHIPLHTGGSARYQLTLERQGQRLRGTYTGSVTGLNKPQRDALWRELDPDFKATTPAWRGGVTTGEVSSITHVAEGREHQRIEAHGRIAPIPQATNPTWQPGLLVPRTAWKDAAHRQRLAPTDAEKATMRAMLDAGQSGSIVPGDGLVCHGFAAAGDAWLALVTDDTTLMERSAEAAQASITAIDTADAHRLARELTGLAVAYDLAGDAWPTDVVAGVRRVLVDQAVRLSATEQPTTLFASTIGGAAGHAGVMGTPTTAADYRLAMLRGAAGLAALAVLTDGRDPAPYARVEKAFHASRRSIERFCKQGIGDRGAGNTNHGYDAAMETVLPFILASRHVTGRDPADASGVSHIAMWAAATDALTFDSPATHAWLPAAILLAKPGDAAAVRAYVAGTWRASHPLAAILGTLAMKPGDQPADPTSIKRVLEDRQMGAYVLRSSGIPGAFVTVAEAGQGDADARHARGRVSVTGLGRQWLARDTATFGDFTWPAYRQQNTVQVYESLLTDHGPAAPRSPARVVRKQATRDGSGSIGLVGNGWATFDPAKADAGEPIDENYSYALRTVGVDYSRASGADAMLVFVESQLGLADRQRVWEASVGPVPAEAVKIDGTRFTLTQPGGVGSMAGTVVYPPTAWIEYVPPADEGADANGRLRIHMVKPGPGIKELFDKSMNETLEAMKKMGSRDEEKLDFDFEDFHIDFFTEQYPQENKDKLNSDANVVFNKHISVVTSTSMGGPNVYPTARNGFILVLTIQAGDATHPPVEVLPREEQAMLKIGGQKVTYWQHLVAFETKGER